MDKRRFRLLFICRRLADKAIDHTANLDEAINEALELIKNLKHE